MPKKVIFLDRDGPINIDHGYVHRREDWEFAPRAIEGLKLLQEAGFALDPDVATNLMMGLEAGSGNFSAAGVTAQTFQMAADLMSTGGRRVPQDAPRAQDFPTGAVPSAPPSWLEEPKIYKGTSI